MAKPILLSLITLIVTCGSVMLFLMLLGLLLCSMSQNTYRINGQAVDRAYFLGHTIPWVGIIAAYWSVLALAFWRKKSWSRHLVMAQQIIACVALMFFGRADLLYFAILLGIAGTAFWGWYFYYKGNVVAYYEFLKNPHRRVDKVSS